MDLIINCRGRIDDLGWAQIRALCAVVDGGISAVARLCRASRSAVREAIGNDVPPSRRARVSKPNSEQKRRIQKRRREVKKLITKRAVVVGKRTRYMPGRPRRDGRARESYVVSRPTKKLVFPSPAAVARELSRTGGKSVSRTTVVGDLKAIGLRCYVRPKTSQLTDIDHRARLSFARRAQRKGVNGSAVVHR